MRIKAIVALVCSTLALVGCQKSYKLLHGSLPSSVKVEKLDMTKAAALTVMPYTVGSKAQTKAEGEEYDDRLFIVDVDGNTKLASFTIKDSNYSNTVWKEIRKSLTLVPTSILPLSQEILLFSGVRAVHDYVDWEQEAMGQAEIDAINDLLVSLEGAYMLRISDGALFRSPIRVNQQDNTKPISRVIKSTANGKNFILSPGKWTEVLGFQIEVVDYMEMAPNQMVPWVICDKGDVFELKYPSENIQENMSDMFGFMLVSDNRIIPFIRGKGVWSYDLELNPLYIDYSSNLQEVLGNWQGDLYHTLTFDSGTDSYVVFKGDVDVNGIMEHGLLIYKVFLNGNELDCSLICSGESINESFDFPNRSVSYPTQNGITLLLPGAKIIIDVKNGTYVKEPMPDNFPQEWNAYDENGIAYVMTDNAIEKYDLNSKLKTITPIHWEQVDFGGFVTYKAFYCNGIFSVSGRTRTAQSVTVLIDAETGNVSVTDLAEYSGSVVKTYYRLN